MHGETTSAGGKKRTVGRPRRDEEGGHSTSESGVDGDALVADGRIQVAPTTSKRLRKHPNWGGLHIVVG